MDSMWSDHRKPHTQTTAMKRVRPLLNFHQWRNLWEWLHADSARSMSAQPKRPHLPATSCTPLGSSPCTPVLQKGSLPAPAPPWPPRTPGSGAPRSRCRASLPSLSSESGQVQDAQRHAASHNTRALHNLTRPAAATLAHSPMVRLHRRVRSACGRSMPHAQWARVHASCILRADTYACACVTTQQPATCTCWLYQCVHTREKPAGLAGATPHQTGAVYTQEPNSRLQVLV
jgi:hypothetical protein